MVNVASTNNSKLSQGLVLFDLDGTLSDPLPGIARSINYALAAFDYPEHPEPSLGRFIGPPLDQTFAILTPTESQGHIQELVEKFRERFGDIGYRENSLYPGVRSALEDLHVNGLAMAVCTSKRGDFAEKIIQMFNLDHLFDFVSGGDIGISKVSQIASLMDDGRVGKQALMIGDRDLDLKAGHANGLATGGVLWGYGSRGELEKENPAWLFNAPEDWQKLKTI